MAVKRRTLDFVPKSTYTSNYSGTSTSHVRQITGRQETSSERTQFHKLHRIRRLALSGKRKYMPPWWPDYVGGLDLGSEFSTLKHDYSERGTFSPKWRSNVNQAGSIYVEYDGPLYAKAINVGSASTLWPSLSAMDRGAIHAKGTTAISRVLPTNPAAGLGTMLGELREGIPRAVGSTLLVSGPKGLGKRGSQEYLNIEFGWKPLIRDVVQSAQAVRDSEKILSQFERDSGRHVRRRYHFPKEVTTTVTTTATQVASPTLNAYFYNGAASGTLERTRYETTETWFSGCFTYYLTAGDTARTRLKKAEQQASKLLGLRVTPHLLYQLTPWSWLIDWNSNLGDVVKNISAFSNDGLVMRWGYVMCTKTITDTYRLPSVQLRNGARAIEQTFSTTQKVRYKATPYGFGLDTGTFTGRQWAILAALGIARGPRML